MESVKQKVLRILLDINNKQNLIILGLALLILAVLVIVNNNQRNYNYKLGQQVEVLEVENEILRQRIENQVIDNDFYQTNYYLDLAARKSTGLTAEGEQVFEVKPETVDSIQQAYQANR